MVNWINLCAAIAKNAERGFHVLELQSEEGVIERFTLAPVLTQPTNTPSSKNDVFDDDELPPPPPPTKSIGMVLPLVSSPVPVVERRDNPSGAVPLASTTKEKTKALPRVTKQAVDPIVVGIELSEPLYVGAPFNNKHAMEVAAALAVEAQMNDLYKTEGGRSRGWTKSGLDIWMKPRCASGGNLKELDRAKVGFAWQLLMDDKAMSSFLDFVCVAKRIRVAVWFEETKTVLVYPAADLSTALDSEFPLYNVSASGHLMMGPRDGKELYAVCLANKYTALPPISVMSSLSGLKVDELENVGKALGMASVDGKKVERVAAIAAYKLRQRFGKN
jgi:hypothetical protein